jgi:oligosaccharide repeat unit polymerase
MALTPAQLLLLMSAALSAVSLIALFVFRITPWTPFHVAFATMLFVAVLAVWPQLSGDSLGRTQYNPIRLDVAATVLAGSIVLAVSTRLLKRRQLVPLPRPDEYPAGIIGLNVNLVALACIGMCLVSSYISYKRLGNLTLIAMSSDEQLAGNLSVGEALGGPVIAIARGCGRILPMLCVVEFVYCYSSIQKFVRRRLFLCMCTMIVLVLEIFDGQRTQIILPATSVIFGLAVANRISKKWVAVAAIFGSIFFVVVGEFRSKDFSSLYQLKRGDTGIYLIDKPLIWLVTYSEPSLYNFNNLVRLHPEPALGMGWFAQMAPSSILKQIGRLPKTAPQYLAGADAYAQPGLTLRTSYADWYIDFGLPGAVVAVCLTWAITVYAFNRARLSPRHLWLYLSLAYATSNLAFLNNFIGIPFELPLLLLPWVRGQRTMTSNVY